MAKYTPESVERVKDAVDMAQLVGARTELRRAGVNRLEGLCPFHDERTPSFGIDPVQKVYYCFGCGAGGDAITFVRETEGLDFVTAIEALADRFGVELEVADEDPQERERRQRRARLYELLERTAAFYVRYLWESREAQDARSYLLGRGLEEEVLRRFRVGYAPSAWDKVLLASRRAGFSNRELYDSGLATRGREARLYDRFRSRITFPLADTRGRVVGFGARAMGEGRGAKYVNTPEGELFHKRRQIYAADVARAAAAKAGSVIVAEGYTDVIALHQAGFDNAVGIMGTSLTEDQVRVLRRLAPVAHLALDADNAGQEAMLRAARVAGSEQLELRVVPLPPGLDPADLVVEQGADEVARLLAGSMPFVRFRVQRALSEGDTSSAEGKDRILAEVGPVLEGVPRSVLRDELVRLVSDRLDVPAQYVEEIGRPGAVRRTPAERPAPAPDAGGSGPPPRSSADIAAIVARTEEVERRFLAFCVALPDLGAAALAKLDPAEHFTSAPTRRAAEHLRSHLRAPMEGVSDEDDPDLAALLRELTARAARDPASPATLDAQRLQLELRRLDRRMRMARESGEGGVTELARRRAAVQAEFDQAMEQAAESA